MPITIENNLKPKEKSLIVCAGTITCSKVSEMGSGFTLFKNSFNKNTHISDQEGGWIGALQNNLDLYWNKDKLKRQYMPAYIRIAKQDDHIGGIATVPVKTGANLKFIDVPDILELEEQYCEAVEQAIADAIELKRPLFIQPLGIGVYGWDAKTAAELFAKVINKVDPENTLDISIPLHATAESSADQKFKVKLVELLSDRIIKREKKDKEKPKPDHLNNDAIKTNLITILDTLIENIEKMKKGRLTSGAGHKKVDEFNKIKTSISNLSANEFDTTTVDGYLQNIMNTCKIKRHTWNFLKTPNSVNEFKKLLKDKKLAMPKAKNTLGKGG